MHGKKRAYVRHENWMPATACPESTERQPARGYDERRATLHKLWKTFDLLRRHYQRTALRGLYWSFAPSLSSFFDCCFSALLFLSDAPLALEPWTKLLTKCKCLSANSGNTYAQGVRRERKAREKSVHGEQCIRLPSSPPNFETLLG